MTKRAFDRFMVASNNGHSTKLARLTDAEFRALVQGIWPIASEATPRGAFMVGNLPATAEDVVFKAPKVKLKTAQTAIAKLRALGMLEHDEEIGGEWVHDWDKLNPTPKTDSTNAKRQAEWRARNTDVTADVTPEVTASNASEVKKVEGEGRTTPLPPNGGNAKIPVRPPGNRLRDRQQYDDEVEAFAAAVLPDVEANAAVVAVKGVLGLPGVDTATVDQIAARARTLLPADARTEAAA
jgi:hypothetical protein